MQGLKLRESRHKKINCCVTETQEFGDGERAEKENQGMRGGEGATRGGVLKKIEEQLGDFPGGPVTLHAPNARGPGSSLVKELDPTCSN